MNERTDLVQGVAALLKTVERPGACQRLQSVAGEGQALIEVSQAAIRTMGKALEYDLPDNFFRYRFDARQGDPDRLTAVLVTVHPVVQTRAVDMDSAEANTLTPSLLA